MTKLQISERQIQNQVRAPASQYTDALKSVTVAHNYIRYPCTSIQCLDKTSSIWGNKFNLRNRSDQRYAARTGPLIQKINGSSNYVNVPTRGNSTRTTITANKPGAMTPGGYGVDVKHDSYARYLGKLKGKLLTVPYDISYAVPEFRVNCTYTGPKQPICTTSMNNKTFKFSLVSSSTCHSCTEPKPACVCLPH